MLPAVFADDDLALRFVGGLDDVLAPILNVLDCLDTYFDPALTPADFAQWGHRPLLRTPRRSSHATLTMTPTQTADSRRQA
ncbi:hypothetical protein ACWDVV_23095, partial [Streptomyces tendae]